MQPLPRKYSIMNFSYFRMWKEAFGYATRRQKATIAGYHLVYITAVAIDLQQPLLLGKLVDVMQRGGPALLHDAGLILLAVMGCTAGYWVLHGPARLVERRTAQDVFIHFVTEAYAKVAAMPLKWHGDHHSGRLINRIMTASSGLRSFIESGFVSVHNIGNLAGAILMLMLFNWKIGILSFAAFSASIYIISVMNRRMIRAMHESNEASHQVNATFFDFVSNMTSIIILRLQKFSEGGLRRKLDLSTAPWNETARVNEWRWFIYAILNTSALALIVLGYIYAQTKNGGAVAAGALVTVYFYQFRIGNQAAGFLSAHTEWLRVLTGMAAARHIFEDHARLAPPEAVEAPRGWETLSLRGIEFSYEPRGVGRRVVLSGLDLDLKHGEKIALIGRSGGGKTTLLYLLRGLHEAAGAKVSIDGGDYPFQVMSGITTLIPQDPEIFENTIRFNVSFGLDVPDAEVMAALETAEFGAVLAQLPNGLDTDIREKGVNLSVGQKQRLALARGIFAAGHSDIILMDEPTSSVDLPSEEKVFGNVFSAFRGKTVVATLHRLHLLPRFDRIVCLDGGKIVADMPSAEALSRPGVIRDLYRTYQVRGE